MLPILFTLCFKLLSTLRVNAQSGLTSGPSVALSYGTFEGFSEEGLDKFLGIPFAHAGYVTKYLFICRSSGLM